MRLDSTVVACDVVMRLGKETAIHDGLELAVTELEWYCKVRSRAARGGPSLSQAAVRKQIPFVFPAGHHSELFLHSKVGWAGNQT